jgi:hypothetical protein
MVITYTSYGWAQRGPSFEAYGSAVEFFGQLDESSDSDAGDEGCQEEFRREPVDGRGIH